MAIADNEPQNPRLGFTLIEIMVVVTIIGLLASIAVPAYVKSRQNSVASRTANDIRQFADIFSFYNISTGSWPSDGGPSTIPSGMEESLQGGTWGQETSIGGSWDFDYNVFGFTAAVSIDTPTADSSSMQLIDDLVDDGNLSTGRLRLVNSTHLSFILED